MLEVKNGQFPWRYSLVANVVKDRIDEDGNIRHGTKEFRAGAKVNLYVKLADISNGNVDVLGVDRYGRLRVVTLPLTYLENFRMKKVFNPAILRLMNEFEFTYGWYDIADTDPIEIAAKIKEIEAYVDDSKKWKKRLEWTRKQKEKNPNITPEELRELILTCAEEKLNQ